MTESDILYFSRVGEGVRGAGVGSSTSHNESAVIKPRILST